MFRTNIKQGNKLANAIKENFSENTKKKPNKDEPAKSFRVRPRWVHVNLLL